MSENIFRLIRLPDLVTLVNALLGFTAILMVVQDHSNADHASILIVMAVITDGIDGAIARRLEYGILGEQLDSLADVVSFGMAPAVIAYAILGAKFHYLICIIGGAFLACGILRLARFNTNNLRDGFVGLPITSSGLAVSLYILAFSQGNRQLFSYGLLALMLVLSLLMISRTRYPKIRDIRIFGVTAVILILMLLFFYLENTGWLIATAHANLILTGLYIISPIVKLPK